MTALTPAERAAEFERAVDARVAELVAVAPPIPAAAEPLVRELGRRVVQQETGT